MNLLTIQTFKRVVAGKEGVECVLVYERWVEGEETESGWVGRKKKARNKRGGGEGGRQTDTQKLTLTTLRSSIISCRVISRCLTNHILFSSRDSN